MPRPSATIPLLLFLATLLRVVGADPTPRFESEIQAFVEADRKSPRQPGGILFVGSSIFREWTQVATAMAPLPVLNRAFGGSKTQDQLDRFDQVVTPHRPRIVVYYCGSNDLKAGDDPGAIFERFKSFSERLHRQSPDCHLIAVSSTRSPDRVPIWDRVDQYNGLVRAHCATTPRHTFVDLNPTLVDAEGRPRLDFFRDDKLHLHPAAYEAFAKVLRPVLQKVWSEAQSEAQPTGKEANMATLLEIERQVTHGFATNNGVRIHYATMGTGPLVVMVHGFPDCWLSWRHQMPALARTHEVVAIDQRGYNRSDQPTGVESYDMARLVEDVEAVIRSRGRDRAVVVGHDWGGAVAW
ncbi:MAG: alpha/beta fold hydrolase, partial [Verrucomicrobiota bacterium]